MTDHSPLRTLTGRTVLLTTTVAIVAALVTILFAIPLINASARSEAHANLDRLADIGVATLQQASPGDAPQRLRDMLAAQNVTAFVVGPGFDQVPGMTREQVQTVIAGTPLSITTTLNGVDYFVSARPLSAGVGLVLAAPDLVADEPASEGLRRLLAALLAGVLAAVVIGFLAARRITSPIRRAADTAERLSRGERGLTMDPTGPAEIADVARSLNALSAALESSEGRQREFLLSVSHELRTPLTAIRGYAEALTDGVIPASDVPAAAGTMAAESDRLDRLVSDLLDLARLGAVDFTINPVDVDLTELVGRAAAVWRARCARAGVELRAELPAAPLFVRTDPVRVRQVIDNLAENALRVTPAGRPMVLSAGIDGAVAVLTVRDGGPGLTADDMAIAFEPAALYARYRGVRNVGSGVGLALVDRLARRMGGAASVGPAPEGGAAFSVRLPRVLPVTPDPA